MIAYRGHSCVDPTARLVFRDCHFWTPTLIRPDSERIRHISKSDGLPQQRIKIMAIISKRVWLVSAALVSAAVVYSIPASKADIIYDVSLQVGSTGSATGFIRTDGFLGT